MASKGINKVILVGNLGQDPETRFLTNGDAVTNITIATSESWKDKNTGQQQERTEWHRVVFFRKLAEIVGEYLRKGSKVYIEGSLKTRSWDKDGVKMYTTEIIASEMQMLDSRGDNQQQAPQQAPQQQAPSQAPQQYKTMPSPNSQLPQSQPQNNDFDDDIPF